MVEPIKATRKTVAAARTDGKRLAPEDIALGRKDIARMLALPQADRFVCRDRHWCAATLSSGWKVVIAENGGYAGIACDLGDIVITPARLKWESCRSGALLFTGETLRRTGTVEIYLPAEDQLPEMIRMVNALGTASRPWDRHRLYDWKTDRMIEHSPAERPAE